MAITVMIKAGDRYPLCEHCLERPIKAERRVNSGAVTGPTRTLRAFYMPNEHRGNR